MKTNYHTHNERCKHAFGTVMDYADYAYERGFDIIGMSDHAPFRGDEYGYRMDFSELDYYIEETKAAREKYKGKMQVRLGLEAEYTPQMESYYAELLEKYKIEYLILGQHFYQNLEKYESYTYQIASTKEYIDYAKSIEMALSRGYFSMVAHPDLIFTHDFAWDDNCVKACDIIINSALKYNTALELNGNGVRKGMFKFCDGERFPYPHWKFFEMVSESKVDVLISADCHKVEELDDEAMSQAHRIAREWNLNVKDVLL